MKLPIVFAAIVFTLILGVQSLASTATASTSLAVQSHACTGCLKKTNGSAGQLDTSFSHGGVTLDIRERYVGQYTQTCTKKQLGDCEDGTCTTGYSLDISISAGGAQNVIQEPHGGGSITHIGVGASWKSIGSTPRQTYGCGAEFIYKGDLRIILHPTNLEYSYDVEGGCGDCR